MIRELDATKVLTFDLFGTVLDLGGSLTPYLADFLKRQGRAVDPAGFWRELRHRQRIEQYQDSLLELGHSGYLETAEKAFSYVCRLNGLNPSREKIKEWMESWQMLAPFPDVLAALQRLKSRFRLPFEDTHSRYLPDVTVANFTELADILLGQVPLAKGCNPPIQLPRKGA
ncbi:MAG: hypothetical protein HY736_02105 [Verrucomicrobia bacterium]|nr:hypothetical protein [Verrucomicrobiota bacterium]